MKPEDHHPLICLAQESPPLISRLIFMPRHAISPRAYSSYSQDAPTPSHFIYETAAKRQTGNPGFFTKL